MAYKRRRTNAGSASTPSSSSRPQSFSRLSSVRQSLQPSTPALPPHPRQDRISLRGPGSHFTTSPSHHDQDVVRADIIENDAETQARENSDAVNEVFMAVEMKDRGTIGCAYYVAREEKLCLMEDIKMANLDIIDTLKVHVQPTVILISTRSDEKLEENLSKDARGIDRGEEASML